MSEPRMVLDIFDFDAVKWVGCDHASEQIARQWTHETWNLEVGL